MGCKNYEELETLADQIQLPDIPRKTTEVSILTHKRTIDKLSLSLVPDENDLQDLFPCLIYGDGNCLRMFLVFLLHKLLAQRFFE
jgi:hypothetical protein